MKNIVFIEGVSGVGKSTTVHALGERLLRLGFSVTCHMEGDPDSPLDLCWAAYLTKPEYAGLLAEYPEFADQFHKNIIDQGDYILLRYQVHQTGLYTRELNAALRKKEFCCKATNIVPLSKFTEVFLNLWRGYAQSEEIKRDYAVFDASLVSHMTNDLVRNYNASIDDVTNHLEALLQPIHSFHPIVFYLSSRNVSDRLIKARESRGQTSPGQEQVAFWEKRKQTDMAVLSKLSVVSHIIEIYNDNWDSVVSEIVSEIARFKVG